MADYSVPHAEEIISDRVRHVAEPQKNEYGGIKPTEEQLKNAGFSSIAEYENDRYEKGWLRQNGFDSMEGYQKEGIAQNEQDEKERLYDLEQITEQESLATLGLKPFSEQEQQILQQFSEQERQIMEDQIAKGFLRVDSDDFPKYVGSVPQAETPEEQLLLFSNFMGIEGSEDERIEKMKKFDVLQENQFPFVPLSDIYNKSLSIAENKLLVDLPCHNPSTGQIYAQEKVKNHQQQNKSDDMRYLQPQEIAKLGMTINEGAEPVVNTYKKENESGQPVQHCEMLFNGKDIKGLPPLKIISEKLAIGIMKVKETVQNIGNKTIKTNSKENSASGFEM